MFGMCIGALSLRNGRPTPWNRPSRSNSVRASIRSSTSSVGKSSMRITRSEQSARKLSGRRRNASIAITSNSASEGALSGRQSGAELSGALIGDT